VLVIAAGMGNGLWVQHAMFERLRLSTLCLADRCNDLLD
jgi:hypothetical protein